MDANNGVSSRASPLLPHPGIKPGLCNSVKKKSMIFSFGFTQCKQEGVFRVVFVLVFVLVLVFACEISFFFRSTGKVGFYFLLRISLPLRPAQPFRTRSLRETGQRLFIPNGGTPVQPVDHVIVTGNLFPFP